MRVDRDLVFLDETADAGDFGDASRLGQLVTDIPVLDAPEVGQRLVLAGQRVLEDPADAGRIRPELRRHPGRQVALGGAEVFEHPRTCPVDIGPVLENNVNVGGAEHRKTAHDLSLGYRQHGRGQRVGDLVLDDLGRLPGIGRVDDDLDVGEVGQRIKRRLFDGINAAADQGQGGQQDNEHIAGRPFNQLAEHLSALPDGWSSSCRPSFRGGRSRIRRCRGLRN